MRNLKRLIVLAIAGISIVAFGGVARGNAQEIASHATKFTFSKPVRLPGVTLPAGTYMFLHPTPIEDYHVIQVMNEKQTRSYGFFLTIPNERLRSAEETMVTFRETPVGYLDT